MLTNETFTPHFTFNVYRHDIDANNHHNNIVANTIKDELQSIVIIRWTTSVTSRLALWALDEQSNLGNKFFKMYSGLGEAANRPGFCGIIPIL